MSFALRRVVRARRLLGEISPKDVTNLRNRLEAARKSPRYNERNFVDVPADQLDRILRFIELHQNSLGATP